ncbi:hypothetical protein SKAU_G00088880 [Synaphobranchus kaupii]|uniref:Uncharacterized protein n=1 Tax=Synaphobranchus kaupii TaxID=118154 RepID=A0A9Q1FX54_SYNKA|nr:hypothetical protein SKAU_G00088880 [Synaphobranchus kaupii]
MAKAERGGFRKILRPLPSLLGHGLRIQSQGGMAWSEGPWRPLIAPPSKPTPSPPHKQPGRFSLCQLTAMLRRRSIIITCGRSRLPSHPGPFPVQNARSRPPRPLVNAGAAPAGEGLISASGRPGGAGWGRGGCRRRGAVIDAGDRRNKNANGGTAETNPPGLTFISRDNTACPCTDTAACARAAARMRRSGKHKTKDRAGRSLR